MDKSIKKFSSRTDVTGQNALSFNKCKDGFSGEVDKKNNSPSNSSFKIESHGKKRMKHKQKESVTKESFISTHHKNSSYPLASTKHQSNNRDKNNFMDSRYSERKEASNKYISYDPHLDETEEYNPEYPYLFHGSKSIKKERDTCKSHLLPSSKSIKTECDLYEPSVKRKLEIQTKVVSESKEKKLKSASKSDLISEKKHKKHIVQGNEIQPQKVESLKQKKSSFDGSMDYLREKSPDKSKYIGRESYKNKEKSSKKTKLKINSSVEFTSSEVNFEDCLGLNDFVAKRKKKSKPILKETKISDKAKKEVKTVNHNHSSQSFHPAYPKNSSSVQKEILEINILKPEKTMKIEDVDIMFTLPLTLPNYRSLPREESCPKNKKAISNEDAALYLSSKHEKTAVYSGRRSYYYTEVPSLFEITTRALIDNIEFLNYTRYTPYCVLKPVLEKCNPQQLLHIENYNPYLLEDTNELWEIHCKRGCKLHKLEENETYRELYLRAQDERERKLKSITKHISASMSKYNPARQVKLAYVDSFVKPPRDVARKQAKNGTSSIVKAENLTKATPKPGALDGTVTQPAVVKPAVVKPVSSKPPVTNHVAKSKPKVAPLMAKTLKSMKQCFRR